MTKPVHPGGPPCLPPDLAHALAVVVAHLSSGAGASEWMHAADSPVGARAIRDAVRRGELPGHKVAKRLLIRRAEHDKWIESHRIEPRPAPEPKAVEVSSMLDRIGTRRRAS